MKIRKVTKHGKERWRVDFRMAGKRQRVFFRDEKAASDFAKGILDETKELGEQAHSITYQERNEFHAAIELLKPTGATLLEAARFFVAHHQSQHPKPLGEAVSECVKAKEVAGKRSTYTKNFRNALKRFIRGRESALCSEVAREQIEGWLAGCGESAATRKSCLTDIQTFFNFGLKRGWVVKNPCAGIEPIMLEDSPPCIFTIPQVQEWMGAIRSHDPLLIPYFALGLFAGVRPAEIKRLTWADINLDAGIISVPGKVAKTRMRRIVHLNPNCVAWLRLSSGLPSIHYRDRIAEVRKKVPSLVWGHDIMRHSFASYHLAANQNAAMTALEAGHTEQVLFGKYREVVTKQQGEEFFRIVP